VFTETVKEEQARRNRTNARVNDLYRAAEQGGLVFDRAEAPQPPGYALDDRPRGWGPQAKPGETVSQTEMLVGKNWMTREPPVVDTIEASQRRAYAGALPGGVCPGSVLGQQLRDGARDIHVMFNKLRECWGGNGSGGGRGGGN
jgi:hypothetical protein